MSVCKNRNETVQACILCHVKEKDDWHPCFNNGTGESDGLKEYQLSTLFDIVNNIVKAHGGKKEVRDLQVLLAFIKIEIVKQARQDALEEVEKELNEKKHREELPFEICKNVGDCFALGFNDAIIEVKKAIQKLKAR